MSQVLVVDGANVVGATPDGWWRDRAGAAARLHQRLLVADTPQEEIVLVLEGKAKGGMPPGRDAHVRVVHAPRDGDATIAAQTEKALAAGHQVVVVTADRLLARKVELLGARVSSPTWLLALLD